MATIVFGGATSHGPLTVLPWEDWLERGKSDPALPLYKDGVRRDFEELTKEAGDEHLGELTEGVLHDRAQAIESALDRLDADIRATRLDVLIVIGDDQGEMFSPGNTPTLAVAHAEALRTKAVALPEAAPAWLKRTAVGVGMEAERNLPVDIELARDLIAGLVEQGFDVTPCATEPEGERALGHAFTFPWKRFLSGTSVRILPVLLNTYYPPNQPSPARCFELGVAIRRAVEGSGSEARVGILASGGLSHFVVEEDLDTVVLDAIRASDQAALEGLPTERLLEGSSEIRNWIAAAGVFSGHSTAWSEYVPVRRTAAGTGCANGFLRWDETSPA